MPNQGGGGGGGTKSNWTQATVHTGTKQSPCQQDNTSPFDSSTRQMVDIQCKIASYQRFKIEYKNTYRDIGAMILEFIAARYGMFNTLVIISILNDGLVRTWPRGNLQST